MIIMELGSVLAGLAGLVLGWGVMEAQPQDPPHRWKPEMHQESMMLCKSMCDGRVLSYDSTSSKCMCEVKQ